MSTTSSLIQKLQMSADSPVKVFIIHVGMQINPMSKADPIWQQAVDMISFFQHYAAPIQLLHAQANIFKKAAPTSVKGQS